MAMSGVTLADDVVAAVNDVRMKKSRYVLMGIGNEGKNVVVREVGERGTSFEDFVSKLSADVPCYAGFDFEYTVNGSQRDKLIMIQWIPDTAKPRDKMMYSASRDALNCVSEGFLPVQANDMSELETEEILRKVKGHRSG